MLQTIKLTTFWGLLSLFLFCGCNGTNNMQPEATQNLPSTATTNDSKAKNKPFVASYPADFLSIAPLADVSANAKQVLRNMHDGIYRYEPNGELVLSLAKDIQVEKDDTFITFTIALKDNILFHNGQEITAEDVKYSYLRLADMVDEIPKGEIKGGGYFKNLFDGDTAKGFSKGSIEVIDSKHLVVKADDNYGVLTTMHTLADGFIVPKNYSEKEQKEFPIGAGPYQFVSYDEGDKIAFKRFEGYHGKKPDIEFVEFHKYADSTVLTLAFQTGEVDFLELNSQNYQTIKDLGLFIQEGPSNDIHTVYMNTQGNVFDDIRVRQAVHYAVDKAKLNQIVADGDGTPLFSHMTPVLSRYYNNELNELYPLNKEKAKQLLAEAGFEAGIDLSLFIVSEEPLSQDIASVLKNELSDVGIRLTVVSVPWNSFYEDMYKGKQYDIAILKVMGYPDPSRVLGRYAKDSGGNMGNYNNPIVDQLLQQAYMAESQGEEVEKIYKQVQEVLAKDAAAFWPIDAGVKNALSKDYKGYQHYPFAFIDISTITYNEATY